MFAHFEFISLYGMASAFFVLCGRDFFKKKNTKKPRNMFLVEDGWHHGEKEYGAFHLLNHNFKFISCYW